MSQVPKPANSCREYGEFVVVEIELCQERVLKQSRSQGFQMLATKIKYGPNMILFGILNLPRGPVTLLLV